VPLQRGGIQLEAFGLAEGANDGGSVKVLRIDGVVEAAHVGGGEFASEIGKGGAELGESFESGAANDGNRVIGRKVMAIVFKGDQAKRINQAVGGIAGDDVHLMLDEGAVDEAEVHDAGPPGEMEGVTFAPAAETVGALEEFVADPDAPLGSERRDIGNGVEVEIFGVAAADDHSECVCEAERFGDFEVETLGIELLDAIVDGGGIACRRFVEDGGEGGAGVLDVEVELAGLESFVDEESAAEIGLADDRNAGAGFNVLGEKFGEDNLFGEEFGADGDSRLWRTVTGGGEVKEVKEVKEIKEVKEMRRCAAHVRREPSLAKRRKNLTQSTQTKDHREHGGRRKEKYNAEKTQR
jgi:hypothetical protein